MSMTQDFERDYAVDPIKERSWIAMAEARAESKTAATPPPVKVNVVQADFRRTVTKAALSYRERMKNQPFLWLVAEAIIFALFIFTFLSGVIFTDLPLITMFIANVQHGLIEPLNRWYIENGRDSFAVVSSLKLAFAAVALVLGYNLVHKYDLDIKTRNAFVRYIGAPVSSWWTTNFGKARKTKKAA